MHRLIFFTLIIFSQIFSFSSHAQTTFSATPKVVTAYKSANIFVFYGYSQFENLTNDTLQMRWVKTKIESAHPIGGAGGGGSEFWEIAIQDPNNFYNPANKLDSADFFLPPMTGSTDKFILQLFPNMAAGDLKVEFSFFPINDPTDTLTVTFDYTAFDPNMTNTEELEQKSFVEISPNPTSDYIFLKNKYHQSIEVSLFNLEGKLLQVFDLKETENRTLDLTHLKKGMYFLKISDGMHLEVRKLVKN